jgi:hypothetical protein
MTKNKTDIATILSTEVETIKTKEELRVEMKSTLKQLDKKLKKLTGSNSGHFKAAGNFKVNENDSNSINIQSCVDLCYLVKALAAAKRIKREFDAELEILNLPTSPICMWMGSRIEDWINDISLRIHNLTYAKQIADLQAAKTRLETFLSEEDRLVKTLTDVELLLK